MLCCTWAAVRKLFTWCSADTVEVLTHLSVPHSARSCSATFSRCRPSCAAWGRDATLNVSVGILTSASTLLLCCSVFLVCSHWSPIEEDEAFYYFHNVSYICILILTAACKTDLMFLPSFRVYRNNLYSAHTRTNTPIFYSSLLRFSHFSSGLVGLFHWMLFYKLLPQVLTLCQCSTQNILNYTYYVYL